MLMLGSYSRKHVFIDNASPNVINASKQIKGFLDKIRWADVFKDDVGDALDLLRTFQKGSFGCSERRACSERRPALVGGKHVHAHTALVGRKSTQATTVRYRITQSERMASKHTWLQQTMHKCCAHRIVSDFVFGVLLCNRRGNRVAG